MIWECRGRSGSWLSLLPKRGVGKAAQNQGLSRLGHVGGQAAYPHTRARTRIIWRGGLGP